MAGNYKNYAYLVMVDASQNNNKFYEIAENDDHSLDVHYGRVGGTAVLHKHYERYEHTFNQLLNSKVNKGYTDVTALHSTVLQTNASVPTYAKAKDHDVQQFLDEIMSSSNEFMKKNYRVQVSDITPKMIDKADADIARLSQIAANPQNYSNVLYEFNEALQQLFVDVPRRMQSVSDHCAKIETEFDSIIERETDMLNNVRGAVMVQKNSTQNKTTTVEEAFNLDIRPVTYKEEDRIISHLGKDYNNRNVEDRYVRAFAVENKTTREAYERYKIQHNISPKEVKLFYHGSKVENWFSIIKTGLLLNPKASITGKMFGQGLYFAPECRKSLNYMDTKGSHWNNGNRSTGYCAIYSVALGKCYEPSRVVGSSFSEKDLPRGTNSLCASKHNPYLGLKNDEYIVYNQSACTIKYIMEISAYGAREKTFNLNRSVLRDQLSEGFGNVHKVPDGIEVEFNPEMLSPDVQQEISQKITNKFDIDKMYIRYHISQDRIEFEGEKADGDLIEFHPDLTRDDYAFFEREMKKTFAVSEPEWKEKMANVQNLPLGYKVDFKNLEKGQKKSQKSMEKGLD